MEMINVRIQHQLVVREEPDGAITVAFMDPGAVLRLVDKPAFHALGKEVRELMQKVSGRVSA